MASRGGSGKAGAGRPSAVPRTRGRSRAAGLVVEDEWDRFFRHPALSYSAQPSVKELIETLAKSDKKVTLVLGAGVSYDAGLPTWGRLIDNIAGMVEEERWAEPMRNDRSDPMRKAEYVLQMAQEGRTTSADEIVRDALYPRGEPAPGNLADAVARLAHVLGDRVRLITTNFDLLVDKALSEYRGSEVASFSLKEFTDSGTALDENSILHVHGVLWPKETPRGPVVLTESQFLQHGEAVRKQVREALKASVVIFIGISLSDPNLIGPLWDLKGSDEDYEEPFFISIASEDRNAPDVHAARAYAVKRAGYLRTELGVRNVFAKSYAQVPQLLYEAVYACLAPTEYASDEPSTSARYGHRLRRVLDMSYEACGCADGEDAASGDDAVALSDRLHDALYGDEGLVAELRDIREQILSTKVTHIREAAREVEADLEDEQFGLFLWLRSRQPTAAQSEFTINLMGCSTYVHRSPWSSDRRAEIEPFSRHAAAAAVHKGLTVWAPRTDSHPWQLWRHMCAVPFSIFGADNGLRVPGPLARNADVLQVGAITLNTTNVVANFVDADTELVTPVSVLSFMRPKVRVWLQKTLSEIANDAILAGMIDD